MSHITWASLVTFMSHSRMIHVTHLNEQETHDTCQHASSHTHAIKRKPTHTRACAHAHTCRMCHAPHVECADVWCSAVCCIVLQCGEVWRSVVQCVTVWCMESRAEQSRHWRQYVRQGCGSVLQCQYVAACFVIFLVTNLCKESATRDLLQKNQLHRQGHIPSLLYTYIRTRTRTRTHHAHISTILPRK